MSKYGSLINQARKTESKKDGKPELLNKPEEKQVNLGIKINELRRRHWVAEAKRNGTSITAVIIEALSNRFGEPNS
jgi:hypothetical protein